MSEATASWKVGRTRVTAVVEAQTDGIPPELFFPEADAATIGRHPWLAPHYAQEAGTRVPTFTRARHLFVEQELDFLRSRRDAEPDARAIDDDSVAPVFDAGLAELVAADADLGLGLRLQATPGHTPGHASLWVESEGERGLVTGDLIHHPVQCTETALAFVSDEDPALALATRRGMLGRLADEGVLTFGTHFPTAPAGHVIPHVIPSSAGDTWRFDPA